MPSSNIALLYGGGGGRKLRRKGRGTVEQQSYHHGAELIVTRFAAEQPILNRRVAGRLQRKLPGAGRRLLRMRLSPRLLGKIVRMQLIIPHPFVRLVADHEAVIG